MSTTVEVIQLDNSLGIVLPKDVIERLHIQSGDTWLITEIPNGIQLTPCDSDSANEIATFKKVMRDNHDVLRKLAE